MTNAKIARNNRRESGKYAKMNSCECCNKPLGDYNYYSLPTQSTNLEEKIGVFGLILCKKCFDLKEVEYYAFLQDVHVFTHLFEKGARFTIKNKAETLCAIVDYEKFTIQSKDGIFKLEAPDYSGNFNIVVTVAGESVLAQIEYNRFELVKIWKNKP
jgi:hypothetical protein